MQTRAIKTMAITMLAIGNSLISCQQQTTTTATGSGYKTMQVTTTDRTLESSFSATIRGRQDVEIIPQVAGTLTELRVVEGQQVRAGQTLFVIDQKPYHAALRQAKANVLAAEAGLATAKLAYESRQKLFAEKVISEYELTTHKNALLNAEAQLAQAQAAEMNAQNNLSYTMVQSPSDGVIGTLPYRQGALVSSSITQPLTTVSNNSAMYVYFSIDENTLLGLMQQYGSTEDVISNMPDIALMLSNGSRYDEQGRIESISGVIDRATGSVSVRARFPNAKRLLHSGATGNVLMPSEQRNCLVIPQAATVQLQNKTLVYKVVDGKAVSTLITVLPTDKGDEYIVQDGLKAGDTIVAEGAGLIREGVEIN